MKKSANISEPLKCVLYWWNKLMSLKFFSFLFFSCTHYASGMIKLFTKKKKKGYDYIIFLTKSQWSDLQRSQKISAKLDLKRHLISFDKIIWWAECFYRGGKIQTFSLAYGKLSYWRIIPPTQVNFLHATLMLCLKIWRKRRVEGRRVERNSYSPPSSNIFKIK